MSATKWIACVSALTALVFSTLSGAAQKQPPEFSVEVLHHDLYYPRTLLILDADTLLVGDRQGRLHLYHQGKLLRWINGPDDVLDEGHGGILDIKHARDYATSGRLFITYSAKREDGNVTRLISATLGEDKLENIQHILDAEPAISTPVHFGAKVVQLADNSLVLTVGEGFDYRESAQLTNTRLGKLLRVMPDGSVPTDNPFTGQDGYDPYLFTLGHRNPQGLVLHSKSGTLFAHEHGPAGGDELNIINAGQNYGWPVITYGRDYSGAQITPYRVYPGMQQPLVDWTPSIAPSSMIEYQGEMFPEFAGDLLVTTLKSRELRWMQLEGNKVVAQKSMLNYLTERLRDIEVDTHGALILLTDGENGRILRVTRKE